MKNLKNILTILVIIFLSGCLTKRNSSFNNLKTLSHISKHGATWAEDQEQVSVRVKVVDSAESTKYFGCNVLSVGYQPVIITIENRSTDFIVFKPSTMGLALVSPKKVVKDCYWNTWLITGTFGYLASVFLWPALIPVAYGGYYMSNNNQEIRSKIKNSGIQNYDNIQIAPKEILTKAMFVEADYMPESFLISLFSKKLNNDLDFWVNL